MLVSVCGTPGTGKTTVCGVMKRHDFEIVELKALVESNNWHEGYDETSGSYIVDIDELRTGLNNWWGDRYDDTVLEGHLSYLAPADIVVVLRANPDIIKDRLLKRGYDDAKAVENAEAEAVSSILSEALEEESFRLDGRSWEDLSRGTGLVLEKDVTGDTPEMTAEWIADIIGSYRGKELKYISLFRPGNVDWTGVISEWY